MQNTAPRVCKSLYLPLHSSATPQTSSSAPGRRSCLWPSALQCTTLEWLPRSGRQLHTRIQFNKFSFYLKNMQPVATYFCSPHSLHCAHWQTHLCRAAPLSSGRPSWSGCCRSSTPGSSGAEWVQTGPVSWTLSAAGCIAATGTRKQSLGSWVTSL